MSGKQTDPERNITRDDREGRDRMAGEGPIAKRGEGGPRAHDLQQERRAQDAIDRAGKHAK